MIKVLGNISKYPRKDLDFSREQSRHRNKSPPKIKRLTAIPFILLPAITKNVCVKRLTPSNILCQSFLTECMFFKNKKMNTKKVNLTIEGYPFVSVPLSDADFNDTAAIYVIICVGQNGSWTTLDVGQSGELGSRINSHDRKDSWRKRCQNIWVCAYQMPSNKYTKEERLRVEKILRQKLSPTCGVR